MNNSDLRTNRQRVTEEEDTIDLLELLKTLWKHALPIILVTVLALCGGYAASKFLIAPKYTSSVTFYVNNSNQNQSGSYSISTTELSAAKTLVDTYVVILKMRPTLEDVQQNTGLSYTEEELKKMISADSVDGTEIFEVKVTGTNAPDTTAIANEIANVLPGHISEVVEGSSVKIVENAVLPTKPTSPNHKKNAMIAAAAAFILMCGIYTVKFLLDTIIHDETYLTQNYDIPVLAVIPDLAEKQKSGYYSYEGGQKS